MITAVSLNPSIDRTIAVERLVKGGLNRIVSQVDAAAGKGVNVALAATVLGERAECIGFMFENGGKLFEERLRNGGAECDFLWCGGDVRVNMKVLDKTAGEITELNASGTPVNPQQLEEMTQLVIRHAQNSDYLVLSGSTPPGCPQDYYYILAQAARNAGCRVILDADGEELRLGLRAKPFLIKPNRYELELLTGTRLDSIDAILSAAAECIRSGVGVAAVSMGGEGSLITDGRSAWRAQGMRVEIKSTVAAGDSMIAGLAAGFSRNLPLDDVFRLGNAAAVARCITMPDRMIERGTVDELAEKIVLEKLF